MNFTFMLATLFLAHATNTPLTIGRSACVPSPVDGETGTRRV